MKRLFLAGAAMAAAAAPAQAATIYSNTFDAPATVAGGVTASLTGVTTLGASNNLYGLSGNFLRNRATGNPAASTVLTLSGLGSHTGVSIGMIFAFLDSWDGNTADFVDIVVDGTTRISGLTYNNASGSGPYAGGGTVLGQYVQADDYNFYSDTTVDLGTSNLLTFGHTGSTLTLEIFAYGPGWQGTTDEAWGMDNLTVTLNGVGTGGVPEPASWAMMLGGFGLMGAAIRRRRASVSVRYA